MDLIILKHLIELAYTAVTSTRPPLTLTSQSLIAEKDMLSKLPALTDRLNHMDILPSLMKLNDEDLLITDHLP